jgi:hypothetical protein
MEGKENSPEICEKISLTTCKISINDINLLIIETFAYLSISEWNDRYEQVSFKFYQNSLSAINSKEKRCRKTILPSYTIRASNSLKVVRWMKTNFCPYSHTHCFFKSKQLINYLHLTYLILAAGFETTRLISIRYRVLPSKDIHQK